jgi:hypothetical protein
MSNYRVDFIIKRPNPKQNRKAFTFTIADDKRDAAENVIRAHASEQLEIISAEMVQQ